MLDLAKLAGKMPGISQHFKQEVAAGRLRVDRARVLLRESLERQEELLELHDMWRDRS